MPNSALLKGRHSIQGHVYHITTCTANRQPYFQCLPLARILVSELIRQQQIKQTVTLAYTIMPDHLHWLFQLTSAQQLSTIIKQIKGRTARLANRRLSVLGKIWQSGFYDHAVRSDESLLDIARYIVANPLRAGLVTSIKDYPHWDCIWIEQESDWRL